MDEHFYGLNSAAVAWPLVGSTPNITQIKIPNKSVHKQIMIEITGLYDQSVGSEVQATEGCRALVDEIRMNLGGGIGGSTLRRQFKGPMLFELNRIVNRAAMPQVDPTVGIAAGKAFSTTFIYDFGMFDTLPEFNKSKGDIEDVQGKTYLDLANYPADCFLEIVWKPFNAYVSGNTQANMSATVVATCTELQGLRIPPALQKHAELILVDTHDMSVTKVDDFTNLYRDGIYSRGLLLRVGTLAATPIVTALTALPNLGLLGTYKNGPSIRFKEKMGNARYKNLVAWDRVGIQLTAGYLWLDHSSDFSFNGGINGNRMALYQLLMDITGTAGTTMQVAQAVVRS